MKTDAQIKHDVTAELTWDAEIDEAKIGVAVSNGAVSLSGHVPTYWQKIAALKAAKRVAGVMAVVNKIDVSIESIHHTTDEGLAERIANVLRWNVSIPGREIKAEVRNGVVTLSGEVDWYYQRSNIQRNIEHVGGVANIIDNIMIKPRVSTADVQQKIKDALKRHADIEATNVGVSILNGVVTLSGTVESMEEMDRIEAAAWTAPGVSRVVDNLHVSRI